MKKRILFGRGLIFGLTFFPLLFCALNESHAQSVNSKAPLRVLYVGGSANWRADSHYENQEAKQKDIARRMASFEKLLKKYFSEVTVINATTYKQELSERYDVTVVDAYLPSLTPSKWIDDTTGRRRRIPGIYLSEDFTKPMLFIGEAGSAPGENVGSKIDWYCLCMDAHAFNYNENHPIFKDPFPVTITTEEVHTPESAYRFEYFFDNTVTKTMPMWRVQTKGYKTDPGFRVGLVSRPGGFDDSPEAESISSGVCGMRNFDAVAIGRHGNFFHWGFAASPEYMTGEAQTVLANAVHYISKFDGKGIIAHKYNRTIPTRGQSFREAIYFISREVYEEQLALTRSFDKRSLDEKALAEAKQAKGETLTDSEARTLDYKPRPEQTYAEFLQYHHGDLFNRFGTDAAAYTSYYLDNKEYFYAEPSNYAFIVDEDAKSLRIPNYDKSLLDRCITLLEKGKDEEKALRVLKRYTLLKFTEPSAWREWYETNKGKLFFTESGGYKFLVNSYDQNVVGNNYPEPFKQ